MPSFPLSMAVVCMSNMNRSMEAHNFLKKKGFNVRSFGVRSYVTLPGLTPNLPVVYDFSTTCEQMRKDLLLKDQVHYNSNGPRPERFQGCRDSFNVIFTCAERVYKMVVKDLCSQPLCFDLCELCQGLQQADDVQSSLAELLQAAKQKTGRSFLHTVCFY
ncbi:hypothetical protein FD755_017586 [Muntiacus reevesi]|uniref:RNA polymerase II subunit A C-terminal domain phosphatase SSU72 n=1 Tax=Muntiacus reevesi TaxID=9886 RepID=A0A5N3XD93_MUNRE|nr:hypothetical protein FD755_017586 [Muntiacus reevesi]